ILPRLRRAPFGRSRRDDHHPLSLARASRAAVIPGRRRKRVYARLRRAMAANPESISPGCGYGFRAPSLTLRPRNDSVPANPANAAQLCSPPPADLGVDLLLRVGAEPGRLLQLSQFVGRELAQLPAPLRAQVAGGRRQPIDQHAFVDRLPRLGM